MMDVISQFIYTNVAITNGCLISQYAQWHVSVLDLTAPSACMHEGTKSLVVLHIIKDSSKAVPFYQQAGVD